MKKYRYNINNLDCPNCARKIEEYLNSLDDFTNVSINFNTSKISFETNKEKTIDELNKLIQKIEEDTYLSKTNEENKKEYHISIIIISLIISIISYFLPINNILKISLYIISYILLLYKTTIKALNLLIKNHILNENALITISTIGAFFLGNYFEGIMVITLYSIGKILESFAINNSRKSIQDIIDIKQDYANVIENGNTIKKDVELLKENDHLVVKKGEKIPVDGIVIKGSSYLDTSSLTGEANLVLVKKNDQVLSGTINTGDILEIKATCNYENSTVYKILELLEYATDKKTKTETIVTKISKYYTPIVLLLSILIIIILPIFNISLNVSLYRGLTFLVISCPCAIAISVPLSYFTAIGTSSKNGILIKGSNYLDNLNKINNIIFDKTGTLTNGVFEVKDIIIKDKKYKKDEIIDILIKGESLSNHIIAKSILKLNNKKINNKDINNFKEITGLGIEFDLNGKHIKIGNNKLCKCNIKDNIHMNIDGKHVASIIIDDGIKDGVIDLISYLNKNHIETYMFTGDKEDISLAIGKKLNIKNIYSEMLPTDKYEMYEKVSESGMTVFVGDGVNDAPVLRRADIGISLGNIGTDVAIEASDIVLVNDEISKIKTVMEISKYTRNIIKENLIFACLVKLTILILSIFGLTNMWFAVFADTGVTLLTILNTLRIMKKNYK